MVALPETDVRRIAAWCASQWPERFHDQVFWESHVRGKSVTLCETRASWDGSDRPWTHRGFAQVRWRPDSSDWSLHWADRNSRWHPYDPDGFHVLGTAAELLGEIDRDPTCIFKG